MCDDEQTMMPALWRIVLSMSCGSNRLNRCTKASAGADESGNPAARRMGELVAAFAATVSPIVNRK